MQSRADTHVHTKYSGIGHLGFLRFPESVSDPRDILKNAHSLGLSVVCITDHNSIEGALRATEEVNDFDGLEVVVGEEISTLEGEVIGLYLNEEIPQGLSIHETLDRIKDQGGLSVAPHPFSLHCPGLKELIADLDLDGIEVLNAGHIDSYSNSTAQRWGASGRWALLGGSDSHTISTLADAYTSFDGQGAEDLRQAIITKKTSAHGSPWRMERVIGWSVGVVLTADVLMLKSIFGLIREADMHDPIVSKISVMQNWKKVVALLGSLAYFTPPVPFLCGITGRRILKRMAETQLTGRKK